MSGEVFDITDFTTVSPLEKLTAEVEACLRGWGLYSFSDLSDSLTTQNATLMHNGVELALTVYFGSLPGSLPVPDAASEHFPRAMIAYMDPTMDFPFRAPPLNRWFGLNEYVVLQPADGRTDRDTAAYYLSALTLAMDYAACALPHFVPVDTSTWHPAYIGYMAHSSAIVRFETSAVSAVPPHAAYMDGLLAAFDAALAASPLPPSASLPPLPPHLADTDHAPLVSVRCTFARPSAWYKWRMARSLLAPPPPPLPTLPAPSPLAHWGPGQDPVDSIELATTWPQFPRDTFVDSETYSDLEPAKAPLWTLRLVPAPPVEGALTHALHDLFVALKDARTSLRPPAPSPTTSSAAKASVAALFAPPPSPLPPPPPHAATFHRLFKSAPPSSLLARFTASLLGTSLAHITSAWTAMATSLRACWEDATPIPYLPDIPSFASYARHAVFPPPAAPPPDGRRQTSLFAPLLHIDTRTALLSQKIRVIALAIHTRAFYAHLVATDGAEYELPVDYVLADAIGQAGESDADADDEFFDPPSTLATATRRVGALRPLEPEALLSTAAAGTGDARIYVPLSPVKEFMSEDRMEETEELLFQLGSTPQAAAVRAEMQSASLAADMSTFLAANPGAALVDFVRWHSPRDYDAATGQLSARFAGTPADNLWLRLWATAAPVPMWELAPLFAYEKEAEHALVFLEHLAPSLLLELLIPTAFAVAASVPVADPVLADLAYTAAAVDTFSAAVRTAAPTLRALHALDLSAFRPRSAYAPRPAPSDRTTDASSDDGQPAADAPQLATDADATPVTRFAHVSPLLLLGGDDAADDDADACGPESARALVAAFGRFEFALAVAASLRYKLGPAPDSSPDIRKLMDDVLTSDGGLVPTAARAPVLGAFTDDTTGAPPVAATREFIFRQRKSLPYDGLVPLGHRMYVLLTSDTFRVATCIAE